MIAISIHISVPLTAIALLLPETRRRRPVPVVALEQATLARDCIAAASASSA